MTSNEIRVDAQLLTGLQIESITGFIWVKDAIKYIIRTHPLSAPIKTIEFESNGTEKEGDTCTISEEVIQFNKIAKHGKRRPIATPYYEFGQNDVTFYHSGNFDITYRYMPDVPQTVDSEVPLPDRYAEPIKFYLAAKMRARIYGQGDPDAQNYDQLFWSTLDDMDAATDLVSRRYRRMPARY